jgi:hypothetical protein
MSSQIDFVAAVGMFITFIAVLLIYMTNIIGSYQGLFVSSELKTASEDLYNNFFSGKGVPSNWEDFNMSPVKMGLVTDLYRLPLIIYEVNGTARNNNSINVSVTFDSTCDKKAWNNTVRVYDSSNNLIPLQLYNQSFCSNQFLTSADLVFNTTFSANQKKTFFVYYSDDKNVTGSNYTMSFTGAYNLTVLKYPLEKLTVVSVAKIRAMRNLTYSEIVQSVGSYYDFNVEIE